QAAHQPPPLERDRRRQLALRHPFEDVLPGHRAQRAAERHPFEHSGKSATVRSEMASGVPRSTNPPGAVVIDPRVLVVGGAVALVGILVVVAFLWMVPHAAVREVRSACASLRPSAPNPAL